MANHKILFAVLAFIFVASIYAHDEDGYKCTHDDQDHEPEFLDIEEDMSALTEEGRLLQSSQYPNIRIHANYDNLNSAPGSYRAYIQNELAPPVIAFFQGALRVKYPVKGNLLFSSNVNYLCDLRTPKVLLNGGVPADYVILFNSHVEDSNTVASSRYCYLASGTKRPLAATTDFNRYTLLEANGDVLLHEKNTYLLIHEMMHTFGFSTNTYKYFIDDRGLTRTGHIKQVTLDGKTSTVLDVPPLTDRLRKFYGCSTLPGAYMENDGGSGTSASHFERKFFIYETMSSGGLYGRRVSEFSLALLEGSGWYAPDYSYAEPYFFGQGQGCSFLNTKCGNAPSRFEEFCTNNERGCAPQGRSGGRCSSDGNSDGCKIYYPDVYYDCENADAADYARLPELQAYGRSAGSKCFTGDLNTRRSSNGRTSFCFKYTCSGSGSNTQLQVLIGKQSYTCESAGTLNIDGYYGSIDCPDPLTFCNTVGKKYCPRNCMGRGTCVNNKCQCNSGFGGVDCGLYV